ncbi:hypothetical protein TRVL_08281 [Trypanosoma vivax]|nr:hypothetical protein TRVL_08281 [Trypanosoma vivax]
MVGAASLHTSATVTNKAPTEAALSTCALLLQLDRVYRYVGVLYMRMNDLLLRISLLKQKRYWNSTNPGEGELNPKLEAQIVSAYNKSEETSLILVAFLGKLREQHDKIMSARTSSGDPIISEELLLKCPHNQLMPPKVALREAIDVYMRTNPLSFGVIRNELVEIMASLNNAEKKVKEAMASLYIALKGLHAEYKRSASFVKEDEEACRALNASSASDPALEKQRKMCAMYESWLKESSSINTSKGKSPGASTSQLNGADDLVDSQVELAADALENESKEETIAMWLLIIAIPFIAIFFAVLIYVLRRRRQTEKVFTF